MGKNLIRVSLVMRIPFLSLLMLVDAGGHCNRLMLYLSFQSLCLQIHSYFGCSGCYLTNFKSLAYFLELGR